MKLRYLFILLCVICIGCAQAEEALSDSVREVLQRSVSDQAAPKLAFGTRHEADVWLEEMSHRLQERMPDAESRLDFLITVHYEAVRAGLDPQLVLGLEQVIAGIYAGFEEISKLFPESISSEINDFSAMQFQICLKSLDDEIRESGGSLDGFTSGKTATLVADRIAKECGIDELFQLSNMGAMEKILFERHVAVSGIIYLLTVCPELKITYRS